MSDFGGIGRKTKIGSMQSFGKAPRTALGQFCFFFLMEFLCFFVICASTRAQASGLYLWTGITSILFSAQSFMLAKMMIDDAAARTWWAGFGTILGGCAGDILSIWATKHIFGV